MLSETSCDTDIEVSRIVWCEDLASLCQQAACETADAPEQQETSQYPSGQKELEDAASSVTGYEQNLRSTAHPANGFRVSPIFTDVNTKEFTQLVATRVPDEDGEDKMWYRRTLQHLKHKNQRQLIHYDRADSFCSTISSIE